MQYSWIKPTEASKPVTGVSVGKTVLAVVPAALLPWLRESIEAEIKYWKEDNGKKAKQKIAEYQALLKNLEGK
jgi:hypothetical protein